jgi:DNA repair protein RecN (Recombination protein N)
MLRLLRVRNFALIDELELEFGPGLNVLTGETGAGKSLIVDALALIGGAKASTGMIRSGEQKAVVEAVFDLPEGLDLEALGLDPPEPGETGLVLRREIAADNRNRVFVNSRPGSVAGLRQIAPAVLDIHGQHEQQTLLDPNHQLALVDRAVDLPDLEKRVRELFHAVTHLASELRLLDGSERERAERLDLLGFQRQELERARPERGETSALRDRVRLLENSGRLLDAASRSYQTLYEDEGSVVERLGAVARALGEASRFDPALGLMADQAAAAISQVEETAFALRDYLGGLEVEPGELDAAQSRLAELERLHRKYGGDLIAHLETVIQELDTIGLHHNRRDQLSQQLSDARREYREAAEEQSGARRTASGDLADRVTAEIRSLAMPNARFLIDWTTVEPGRADGIDTVRFLLAANRGEAGGELAGIASGGEISRTMLALRTVLDAGRSDRVRIDAGHGRTLVFDEIDAGIGGEAAEVVGRKLRGLAQFDQVLSVTHLAQIARFADHHARIEKRVVGDRTVTRVETLDETGRIEELARMMSGRRITETARRHVRELLERG